jgi:hypothetical protein
MRSMAAVAVLLVTASAAQAGVAEDLIAAINRCAGMPDEDTRHSCYDRLPAVVKSLTATAAAAQAPTATPTVAAAPAPAATPAPVAQPESKGFLSSLFGSEDEPLPTEIATATVASFTYDYGLFVVTLDNGQVWRQVAAQGDRVPLSQERKNQVKIWRRANGEFVLKIDNSPTKYHVRRIK